MSWSAVVPDRPNQRSLSTCRGVLLRALGAIITLAAFGTGLAMRFQLVDRVLDRGPDRLKAVKTVTSAEEYLADHFPGFPVLPGVLMVEAMVQAGRLLITGSDDPMAEPWVLSEVRNVRYGSMVQPGQVLVVEVTRRKQDERGVEFQGVGTVEDQLAVQGRFRLTRLDII